MANFLISAGVMIIFFCAIWFCNRKDKSSSTGWVYGIGYMLLIFSQALLHLEGSDKRETLTNFAKEHKTQFEEYIKVKQDSLIKSNAFNELKDFQKISTEILEDLKSENE